LSIDKNESDSTDCLWTFLSDCLLADHVIDELLSRACTGFETDLVIVEGFNTGKNYKQFRAVGWGGIAPTQSGIREIDRCEYCGHLTYSGITDPGHLFNISAWDGSDVFFIWPLPKFICLSEKSATVFSRLSVSGIELVPVEELRTTGRGFSPGRLSHWISKERAIDIGRSSRIE
jgi:hypothetical protein